jgi:hypothetical protein
MAGGSRWRHYTRVVYRSWLRCFVVVPPGKRPLSAWRWRLQVPPKHWYLSTKIHGIRFPKTPIFTLNLQSSVKSVFGAFHDLYKSEFFRSTTFPVQCPYWLVPSASPALLVILSKHKPMCTEIHPPYAIRPWRWRLHVPPKFNTGHIQEPNYIKS